MSRLYTFGCSFSRYFWPTWATLLHTIKEGENWAMPGMGNKFIFESFVECMITNKINKNDTVIIMWTSWFREDRFLNGDWMSGGNVYNHQFYDNDFLKKYWDDEGAVLHTLNYMSATLTILESIGCKYIFACAFPLFQVAETQYKNMLEDIVDINKFTKYIDFIKQYEHNIVYEPLMQDKYSNDIIFNKTPWSNGPAKDNHPTPEKQYLYVKDNLLPKLELNSEEIIQLNSNADTIVKDFKIKLESNNYTHPMCENSVVEKLKNRI